MTLTQQIIIVAIVVTGTVFTRALPFLVFSEKRSLPPIVNYLGKVLPLAIFALLVIYCLKNVDITSASHGIPEAIGVGITATLHLWRRNMLLSIAGGTIIYMILTQTIFA